MCILTSDLTRKLAELSALAGGQYELQYAAANLARLVELDAPRGRIVRIVCGLDYVKLQFLYNEINAFISGYETAVKKTGDRKGE